VIHPAPSAEHKWLERYLGDWTYSSECPDEKGGPPMKFEGQETFRKVGDLWVQGEGRGRMPGGGEAVMLTTIGFDPARGKFVGTWVGSMMSHLWNYEGWLEGDDTLILEASGPVMGDPSRTTRYRDCARFERGTRHFWSMMLQDDGAWKQIMSMEYKRA
jgi:hypothetical protein